MQVVKISNDSVWPHIDIAQTSLLRKTFFKWKREEKNTALSCLIISMASALASSIFQYKWKEILTLKENVHVLKTPYLQKYV